MQLLPFLDETVDVGSNIAKAMSNTDLWIAIAKTIIIIFLGFILTKKKIFPQGTGKVLTKVVMTVALPCLAFSGFITDYSLSAGIDAIVNLVFGFIIYIVFIFLSKLIFIW
ncbi:MAG TPA: malate permease, partial [Firmicutes bacterium]|nr:malate permease [Bacillota bacterium]